LIKQYQFLLNVGTWIQTCLFNIRCVKSVKKALL
jgi:hypothetical protein